MKINKKQIYEDLKVAIITLNIGIIIFLSALSVSLSKREKMTVDTYTYVSQQEYDKINGIEKRQYDEVTIDGVILLSQEELDKISSDWKNNKQ